MQLRGTGGTSCPKCTGRGRRKDAMRQKYPMLGKWDRDGKAEQAQIGESTQCMHSTVREEALTAAGVQCADAILLQQIAKPLFRSMFVARTRQGLARNYFDHMWMRGGRGSWQQRIDQHF
ncbi:TPA: hypothetical protein ACH3X1_007215 [Trebouxia sp. C0004]